MSFRVIASDPQKAWDANMESPYVEIMEVDTIEDIPGKTSATVLKNFAQAVEEKRLMIRDIKFDSKSKEGEKIADFCIRLFKHGNGKHKEIIKNGKKKNKGGRKCKDEYDGIIYYLRNELKWTQAKIAEKLQVSPGLVGRRCREVKSIDKLKCGFAKWINDKWSYSTEGKERATEKVIKLLRKRGFGPFGKYPLKCLIMAGEGREIKRLDEKLRVQWNQSVCVEKSHVVEKKLQHLLKNLKLTEILHQIPPVLKKDIDSLVTSKKWCNSMWFDFIHLDYNGPLTMGHVTACQACEDILEEDGLLMVTVNTNDRIKSKLDYEPGKFPWIKKKRFKRVVFMEYEGLKKQKMEVYIFKLINK